VTVCQKKISFMGVKRVGLNREKKRGTHYSKKKKKREGKEIKFKELVNSLKKVKAWCVVCVRR